MLSRRHAGCIALVTVLLASADSRSDAQSSDDDAPRAHPRLPFEPVVAPDASVRVTLVPPRAREGEALVVGEHADVVARIELDGGARGPWMLTPSSDGPALAVVRGRLLSIDADALEPSGTRTVATLRIPVVAAVAGTTVLRARVSAYGCAAERCRPIHGEASLVVEVASSPELASHPEVGAR